MERGDLALTVMALTVLLRINGNMR